MQDEWAEMGELWRSERSIGPEELARLVASRRARVRRALSVEWAAAVLLTSFWALVIARHPAPVVWALGGVSVAFAIAWLVVLHRTVRAPEPVLTVREHLRQQLEQARAEARWYRLSRGLTLGFGGLCSPLLVWKFAADREVYLAEPWRAVVGFGGFAVLLAIVIAIIGLARRRAERGAAGIEAALARLEGDPT